jgi:hypothetical protein
MRRVFWELIGRIIEAYVDDIVVKLRKTGDLVPNLTEVFQKLQQHGVKLNPEKCIFGVPMGMLLGFAVSERGIEVNPEKISAIMDMGRSRTERRTTCHGMPCSSEPLHSTTQKAQPTTVQADEEVRPLHMDPRSTRGA